MKQTVLGMALLSLILVTSPAYASIDRNLGYGAKGEDVLELQDFLTDKGFYKGPISGSLYSLTRTAVMKFQKSIGLTPSGYVGPLTREEINAILNDSASTTDEEQDNTVYTDPNLTPEYQKTLERNRQLSQQLQANLDLQDKLNDVTTAIKSLQPTPTPYAVAAAPMPTPTPTPVPTVSNLNHVTVAPEFTYDIYNHAIRLKGNDSLESVEVRNLKYSVITPGLTTSDVTIVLREPSANVSISGSDGIISGKMVSPRDYYFDYLVSFRSPTGKKGDVAIRIESGDATDEYGNPVKIVGLPLVVINGTIQ